VRTLLRLIFKIRYNSNPDTQDHDGTSLLMMAAEKGDHELVKLLIDYNCRVNLKNNQ